MRLRPDSPKLEGARRRMVEKLRAMLEENEYRVDEDVLTAMNKVPRHVFFDSAFDSNFAYENKAFKIGAGQTISQPYTVAFQTTLLEVKRRHKVLEIGTGSGYQSAVLMELGVKLFSIERQKILYEQSKNVLPAMGYNAKLFYGDGYVGLPTFAPFDRVLVTAGAPFVPQALIDQLAPGGILVIPVGEGDTQEMLRIRKLPDGTVETENHGDFSFVPMLQDTAK